MLFLLLQIAVAPDPDGRPVLGPAIEKAPEGATLALAPGVYRETVTIAKPLHLKGVDGVILDPSEPLRARWLPAPEIGPGVQKFESKEKPRLLMLDGRIVAEIDPRRADAEGPWSWKTLLAAGPPLSKWSQIRALWTWIDKTAYVRAENPGAWTVTWSRDAVVTVRASATLSGLTIRGGFQGVAVTAKEVAILRCSIASYERDGIAVSGGASGCRIEGNKITRGALEDWTPDGGSKPNYEIWKIHKTVGFYDRPGVRIFRAGAGTLVKGNHIFETFDGVCLGDHAVESLDIPLKDPDHGRGTEIRDNLIERTRDSGIELGVGCVDVKVHHNVLRRTHGGLRFKLPRIGPVFIYRNLLEDGSPFNIWFSMDDSPAEGYVYHNTVVGGGSALIYSSLVDKGRGIGAPRWRFYNNLFVTKGFFKDHRTGMPVNFTAEHNVVVGGGRPGVPEPGARYVDDPRLDDTRRPLPGSPAVDAGRDLSTVFRGGPLPGLEPARGAAPDAGAFEAVE